MEQSHISTSSFEGLPKHKRILENVFVSFLTYTQILLFPLVDVCHWGYITKLKNKHPDLSLQVWTLNDMAPCQLLLY
jgi:hypothetical protein